MWRLITNRKIGARVNAILDELDCDVPEELSERRELVKQHCGVSLSM